MDTSSEEALYERKPYYVAVGAGQILDDPTVAAYELEILANEEELGRLQELFEELASWDEAQTLHFAKPFVSFSTERINLGYDHLLGRVYKLLHELGTEQTKSHIESMNLNVDSD
ncbi:hypothetical protein ACFOQM_12000 [Paenibacillus sp. GCM10012307]|uniref:Uncharacterized protein n=1 Tax=Paenibacillus roseus TaxID=2798579 RepID=A0A934IZC3_9BACL|nr:hypothetical protein [Paenibacillus roseus]MBJ6362012.1 hypothetical protein [Paenibacillus roseus]